MGVAIGLLGSVRADPNDPGEVAPLWTNGPVKIDRDTQERERERLPDRRFSSRSGAETWSLRVDAFPRVESDVSFLAGGRRWRIAHLRLPELGRRCPLADGREWPCGVRAWAHVSGFFADHRLRCRPAEHEDDPVPVLECSKGGVPVADALVSSGWVMVTEDAPADLAALRRRAVTRERGLAAKEIPP